MKMCSDCAHCKIELTQKRNKQPIVHLYCTKREIARKKTAIFCMLFCDKNEANKCKH